MKQRIYSLLLLCLCVVFIILYNVHININRDTLTLMGFLGFLQLSLSVISWVSTGKKLISPYVIFLFVLYVFSFGQSLLYPFDLISERRDLYDAYGYSANVIFSAQTQTLLMLNVFHLAGLKYSKYKVNHSTVNKGNLNSTSFTQLKRLRSIGWFLFAISFIPFVYDTVSDMIMSMTYGYGSLYQTTAKIGIENSLSLIAALFIPSVICLFIVYRENKKWRIFLTAILLFVILATLIIGGRSNAVILLSLLVILYEYLVRPFSKKVIFLGLIGAFFFLQLLSVISNIRSADDRRSALENTEVTYNPAVEAIAEMGWTQFCMIESMQLIPKTENFKYGKSYLYAFTSIIPNMGFWVIHPAMKEANLGDWLTDALGLNFGSGFSMCAEAWVNFGAYGFLVFILWGALLGSLFGKIEKTINMGNFALLAFLLIMFWFCLKIPRNSFLNVVRAVFYYAGPIYLYCNNFKLRRK